VGALLALASAVSYGLSAFLGGVLSRRASFIRVALLGAGRRPGLVEAFALPGALRQMVTVPFSTVAGIVALHLRMTEALVHGWDLARAAGQSVGFPADLAEQELAFSRDKLSDVAPGRSPFAPAEPVADDAQTIDRLAALLGRSVIPGTAGSPGMVASEHANDRRWASPTERCASRGSSREVPL